MLQNTYVRLQFTGSQSTQMSLSVNVLLPNGRRRNVKLSPNTVVSQTLGDLCKREGYSTESYSFLFQRKILDEALSWRYSNVPNNAKLELVKREKAKQDSPVRIALQYTDGKRLQGTFQPSIMLSEILDHWQDELSLVNREDNLEPCIVYVRQEISGRSKLSTTTLKSLGLSSGSAILRLLFKPSNDDNVPVSKVGKLVTSTSNIDNVDNVVEPSKATNPMPILQNQIFKTPPAPQATPTTTSKLSNSTTGVITQEMLTHALKKVSDENMHSASMSHFCENDETTSSNTSASTSRSRITRPDLKEMPRKRQKQVTPPPDPQPDFSDFKFPEETAGMDIYSPEENNELSIEPLMNACVREEIMFDEREVINRSNSQDVEDPGDEFFELTIDDIRRMISDLRSLQNDSAEKPLVTARSRELQRLRAINQYPKIIVRIIFPNRKILQGFFRPAEKVEVLYEFVAQFLTLPKPRFFLYTTPPKVVLKDKNAILYDYNLSPASKVYFGLDGSEFHEDMFSEKAAASMGSIADANMRFGKVFELKAPEQRQRPTNGKISFTNFPLPLHCGRP